MSIPSGERLLDLATPRKFAGLYDPPLGSLRWRVYYGGRAAGRSWQMARALLIHGMERPLRIGCFRQYQTTIRESVHKLLALQISALGLGSVYDVSDRAITGKNGTEFIFRGIARDPDEVKSLEAIDVAWVEEAQNATQDSWDVLIPTIRKDGSEIWVSFNPGEPTDPTWQMLIANRDDLPRALVVEVSYLDNPFTTEVTREEAESLRRRDPEAYEHVWGGKPWTRSELQIFKNYRILDLGEPQESWGEPLFGADWGFSSDPSVLVKVYVFDSRLYIAAEEYGVQLLNDELARRFARVPGSRTHRIRADSARPETIAEMKRRGFKVIAAPKWAGSVEDGIEHIRGEYDEVVIHPACALAAENFRLYRYKADKRTGDPLPEIQKGNDHVPDALRYALAPLIRQGRAHQVWWPGMTPEAEVV